MKNYLICNIQEVADVDGNVLGKRVCDVSDSTFPVSADYEWKQYAEFVDIYTGAWYWLEKPVEYVAPPTPMAVAPETEQPTTTDLETL
jgi:hypothetical protein